MSTFGGRFEEPVLDWIAVDDFTPENHSASAFFLSHLHTDHMRGLDSSFFDSLMQTKKSLYCSKVTETFLRKKRKECFYNTNIIPLEENLPSLIKIPNKDPVQVTLISAGHCPGSVMFLFEVQDTKVLYTGDFRLPPCDLPKYRALHDSDKEVKKLNAVYLDTTFAFPEYETFPSREQTRDALINIVKQWLNEGADNKVGIVPPANYGLEFLVHELAKAFKQKVYIKSNILFENYKCICELSELVTKDSMSTQIHLCEQCSYPFHCEYCSKTEFIKRIRPSAMKFTQQHLKTLNPKHNNGIVDDSKQIISIAYSNHCSLEELKGFLKYVSKDGCQIHACVVKRDFTEQQVLENLGIQQTQSTLKTAIKNEIVSQNKRQISEGNTSKNSVGDQNFNLIKNQRIDLLEPTEQKNKDLVSSAKELFGLDSPPRPRKFNKFN